MESHDIFKVISTIYHFYILSPCNPFNKNWKRWVVGGERVCKVTNIRKKIILFKEGKEKRKENDEI